MTTNGQNLLRKSKFKFHTHMEVFETAIFPDLDELCQQMLTYIMNDSIEGYHDLAYDAELQERGGGEAVAKHLCNLVSLDFNCLFGREVTIEMLQEVRKEQFNDPTANFIPLWQFPESEALDHWYQIRANILEALFCEAFRPTITALLATAVTEEVLIENTGHADLNSLIWTENLTARIGIVISHESCLPVVGRHHEIQQGRTLRLLLAEHMIRTVLGLSERFMLELRGYEYPFYVDDGTASGIARLFVHCPELPANLRTTSTTAVTRISEVLRFRVSITFLAGIRPYFIDSSSIQPSIISKVALERSAQVDSPN
ncbi:uncharacterized protein LA080_010410 [Diaporthe eres]|nr:uncharacterized protein LA080_010410 [Diaporthe eres]